MSIQLSWTIKSHVLLGNFNGLILIHFSVHLISDTCGIHRGKPLEKGESRIALTSYSYPKSIPEQILNLSKQGEIYNT